MVLDKYINIKADKFVIGQDKDKLWFCKEFHADTTREIEDTIAVLNRIFNKANEDLVKPKKEKVVVKKAKKIIEEK
jgi:hypothetical protein